VVKRSKEQLVEHLLSRTIKQANPLVPGDCLIWQGWKRNGYASAGYEGKMFKVHRFLFEYFNGPLGDLDPDHLCRVRACINIDHLEAVTRSVNLKRAGIEPPWAKDNRERTHCPKGHPYAGDNLYMYKGGRYCRACRLISVLAYEKRKKEGC
jgi:HNH endonuclease